MYTAGIVLSVIVMYMSIRAAHNVITTSLYLPINWFAVGVSSVCFAIDSIPRWGYVTYFMLMAISMFTSATIVYKNRIA